MGKRGHRRMDQASMRVEVLRTRIRALHKLDKRYIESFKIEKSENDKKINVKEEIKRCRIELFNIIKGQ